MAWTAFTRAAIATLAIAVLNPARPSAQAQRTVPVPFFDVDALSVTDGIAVGLYSALTGERGLFAMRLDDGTTVARVDNAGRTVFHLDGHRLVLASSTRRRVMTVDLQSGEGEDVWPIPEGKEVTALHGSGGTISALLEGGDELQALFLGTSGAVSSLSAPMPAMASGALRLVSADYALVALDPAASAGDLAVAVLSRAAGTWSRVVLPDDTRVIALSGERVVAFESAGRRLVQASLPALDAWTPVIALPDAVSPSLVGVTDEPPGVSFIDRSGATTSLVFVSLVNASLADRRAIPEMPAVTQRQGWNRDTFAWAHRRDGRLFLSSVPVIGVRPERPRPARPLNAGPGGFSNHADVRVGYDWLVRQLGAPFLSRQGRTARLIDSYEDNARAGWIYDAAVAAIAFIASGDPDGAAALLAGLEHLQDGDGAWRSSYDPDTARPRGSDRYVGAMAWVVMAANFFEWRTGDERFAAMARRGLKYLERYREADGGSDLKGAFSMGPGRRHVISTEHNVDCYSAFLWRGRLDGDARALTIAEGTRAFVLRQVMADHSPGAPAGAAYFRVGPGVADVYLDVQTWTALAIADRDTQPQLERALRVADRMLAVEDGRLAGVTGIAGLDDSVRSGASAKVWAEGTEGMVAALRTLGDRERAGLYHRHTSRYRSASGGIPYATENDHGWSTAPSVAATAWHLLNSTTPAGNPFDPSSLVPPVR